ncbi:MAG: OmpA family protein [Pseudomonadota bacterium]
MQLRLLYPALIIIIIPVLAFAQNTNLAGYNIQNFRPASDNRRLLQLSESATLGHLNIQTGVCFNGSHGLLSAGNPVNNSTVDIIDTMITGDFLFGIGISDYVDLGIDLPIYFFERGRDFNNAKPFDTMGVGDVRLDAKFRLVKDRDSIPGVAISSSLYLPTGSRSKFTGYKNVAFEGSLVVDKKIRDFYISANTGYRVLPRHTFANMVIDDEMTFGLGAAYTLPIWNKTLDLTAEVFGSAVVRKFQEITTPLEILAGVKKRFVFDRLAMTLAGGRGITKANGSPDYRAVFGINYLFEHVEKKRVGDSTRKPKMLKITIYFDFDSANLNPRYRAILDELMQNFEDDEFEQIQIEGYADNIGTKNYNLELSKRRAFAVQKFFAEKGIKDKAMTVKYYGEEHPATSNSTKDGRAQNRRVEIDGGR